MNCHSIARHTNAASSLDKPVVNQGQVPLQSERMNPCKYVATVLLWTCEFRANRAMSCRHRLCIWLVCCLRYTFPTTSLVGRVISMEATTMLRNRCSLAFASLLLFCSATLLAQSTPPAGSPSQTQPGRRGNFEPCWQQAGIQKSVMEQRWAIERDTRSQVEAVCSNSSLNPQQKHQQAREIRQQAHQKMEGLVTPDQEKALASCQQARGMNHGGGGSGGGMHEGAGSGMHEGAGGGCGDWPHGGARPGAGPNGAPGSNGAGSNPQPANPSSPQN